MIWTLLVVLAVVGGPLLSWWLIRAQVKEDREKRRLEIHRWAMEADREALKAAAMAPLQFKGYRMPEARDFIGYKPDGTVVFPKTMPERKS